MIDRKFTIQATCREHGHAHTEADSALFLAKDIAFPAALRAYIRECVRLGADERQIAAAKAMMERVVKYQAEHPDLIKVPDVDDTPLGREIAAPNT